MPLIDIPAICAMARELREKADFERKPYSAKRLMEACFPDVLVTGAELPRGVSEVVEVIGKRRTIYYSRKASTAAQRVGVIHGVAHLVWDAPDGRLECERDYGARQMAGAARERRADLLAGEILVPLVELDALIVEPFPRNPVERHVFEDHVDHLSSKFGVPQGFLKWRVWDLMQLRKTNYFVPAE